MKEVLNNSRDHPGIKKWGKAVEEAVRDKMLHHLDNVVAPLYALLKLTERSGRMACQEGCDGRLA